MLTIRQSQFASMEKSAFEEWFARHLDAYFPQLRELYPGEGHRQFIDHGIKRARSHGFSKVRIWRTG